MASNFSCRRELNEVLFEGGSYFKRVILNRPNKLNILSYEMISQMLMNFRTFEADSRVKFIILKGNGNAFCAGGDVLSFMNSVLAGHWSFGGRYHKKQFNLDYLLATYKKPVIPLVDGIVMGGGAGLSIHGRLKIVTENTIFAMPEVSFGHFPDVGASHFLSRLYGYFGEYLGLTGAKIDGAEMLACGLASHFIFAKDLCTLENELEIEVNPNLSTISSIIEKFAQKPKIKEDSPYNRMEIINKCFSKATVEEILHALENQLHINAENWIYKAINSMKAASPVSLKITLRSIREGRAQNLKQCLIREYTIFCNIIRTIVSYDSWEGSRALFYDKDKRPKWEPSKLGLVSEEMVDCYFKPIDEDDWKFLKLPLRFDPMENISKPRL